MIRGYFFPVLFGLEFLVIPLLNCPYFRRREGLGRGQLYSGVRPALFLCILFVLLILPVFTGTTQTEAWPVSKIRPEGCILCLNAAMMVLAFPFYFQFVTHLQTAGGGPGYIAVSLVASIKAF